MTLKEVIVLIFVAVLFLASSYFTNEYAEVFQELVALKGIVGILSYLFVAVAVVVIAPLGMVPLVPIASEFWGPLATSLMNVGGWTVGSVIAFVLARRYGRPIIERFVSLERIEEIENAIPERNLFWGVLFLRITIPADILSYAIGFFTRMPLGLYTLATFIGVAPFAFVLAYAATLPIWYQVGALALAGIALLVGYFQVKKRF